MCGQQAVRGEVDQPDGAAGSAHAQQLVGDALEVMCPHDPGRRGNDAELGVGEWQVIGVGLDPVDRQPSSLRHPAARGEVLGSEI